MKYKAFSDFSYDILTRNQVTVKYRLKGGKVGEVGMTEYIVRYENEYLQLLPDKMQLLVRCKDCKHHGKDTCSAVAGIAYPPPDEWFCADGERKAET